MIIMIFMNVLYSYRRRATCILLYVAKQKFKISTCTSEYLRCVMCIKMRHFSIK